MTLDEATRNADDRNQFAGFQEEEEEEEEDDDDDDDDEVNIVQDVKSKDEEMARR